MTLATTDYSFRRRRHTTIQALAPSGISSAGWRRISQVATLATVSVATIVGVSIGLAAPAVSPVAPSVVAAAPTAVTAVPAPGGGGAADGNHDHGRGGDRR